MPRTPITPLVELCNEIGLPHLQATELFRRIDREVSLGNEVIVQEFGTFYLKRNAARVRRLNGTDHQVPANERTALRGQRFPSQEIGIPTLRYGLAGPSPGISSQVFRYTSRSRPVQITTGESLTATFSVVREEVDEPEFLNGIFSNIVDVTTVTFDFSANIPQSGWRGIVGGTGLIRQVELDQTNNVFRLRWRPYIPTLGNPVSQISLSISNDADPLLRVEATVVPPRAGSIPDGAIDDEGFPT